MCQKVLENFLHKIFARKSPGVEGTVCTLCQGSADLSYAGKCVTGSMVKEVQGMYQMQEEKSAGRKDREVRDIGGHYGSLLKVFLWTGAWGPLQASYARLTISM